jgi:hypothetical protein
MEEEDAIVDGVKLLDMWEDLSVTMGRCDGNEAQ